MPSPPLSADERNFVKRLWELRPVSAQTFFKRLVRLHRNFKNKRDSVIDYISSLPAYVLFSRAPTRPRRRHAPTRFFNYELELGSNVFVDCMYLKGKFLGPQFIVVALDFASKKPFFQATARLTSEAVANAFEKIIQRANFIFKRVITDAGGEFLGKQFQELLKRHKIEHVLATKGMGSKSFAAERTILNARRILARLKAIKGGVLNIVHLLPLLEEILSKTPSRMTGMRPVDITSRSFPYILMRLKKYRFSLPFRSTPPKFDVGDSVRLLSSRGAFAKTSDPAFSSEVYKIAKIKHSEPETSYYLFSPQLNQTLFASFPESQIRKSHD